MSPIKKILKSIFPIVFLKRCFLWYNRIKLRTIDKIFFPAASHQNGSIVKDIRLCPAKVYNVSFDFKYDATINKFFSFWKTWTDREFILHINQKVFIEPETGWAFTNRNRIIPESLGLGHAPHVKKPAIIYFLFGKRKVTTLEKVISLRDTGEENYFHFYNDVLAKIYFLKNENVDMAKYTFVISEKLWVKNYFQNFLNLSDLLKSLRWHVQKDDYVIAEEALFCKPLTHRKEIFDDILKQFHLPALLEEKRIYLKRGKSRLRYIANEDELEKALIDLNFEVIDADLLTTEAQVRLFASVRYLVAVHGAGLTNMIFRRNKPLSVLEIFPYPEEGILPFHYIMLAQQYNYTYRAVLGEQARGNYSGGFYVNTSKVRNEILELLGGKNEE